MLVLYIATINDKGYSKQLYHSTGLRRQGCGQCEACGSADCGACHYCLHKKKFGGKDCLKQRCIQRRCKKLRCKKFQTSKHKPSENLTVSNGNIKHLYRMHYTLKF